MFEQTSDHLREPQHAPQSSPSMHQTPLHILMTPDVKSGQLLTLPGGNLPKGIRGSTSILANATHIIKKHEINFTPKAAGYIQDEDTQRHGYAFLVEPAHRTPIHKHYRLADTDMIPASPQPDREPPLELHHWTSLLARIRSINYRHEHLNQYRTDEEKLPLRTADEAFVRAFGKHILLRSVH